MKCCGGLILLCLLLAYHVNGLDILSFNVQKFGRSKYAKQPVIDDLIMVSCINCTCFQTKLISCMHVRPALAEMSSCMASSKWLYGIGIPFLSKSHLYTAFNLAICMAFNVMHLSIHLIGAILYIAL